MYKKKIYQKYFLFNFFLFALRKLTLVCELFKLYELSKLYELCKLYEL